MVNADSSYIETSEAASHPGANQPSSFFRTMLAFTALDVLMLFWILSPLSKVANSPQSGQGQRVATVQVVKPSPLGAVAKYTSLKTRTAQQARSYNAGDERRFVGLQEIDFVVNVTY